MRKTVKKAASLFISLVLAVSGFSVAFAEESEAVPVKIKGDVNCDGDITIDDVTTLQKYVAFLIDESEEDEYDFSSADANGDGLVDINDPTYLQMIIAGIESAEPEEPTEATEEVTEPEETTEAATDPTEATEEATEPEETTEAAIEPTEATEEVTEPEETTEAVTDPTEATEEATEPEETTEAVTDPTEATEEATEPEETTEAATDPTEATEEATESEETTEAATDPTEATEEATEPEETTEPTEEPAEEDYYIIPESNTRLLDVSDLEGLSYPELELARNEIYARHGRLFDTDYIQEYFNNQSWYEGTIAPEDFDYSVISETELANVWLIYDYEHREYILPESDNRLLTVSDIEDLSPTELELARNEIYARHGRLFDTDYIQEYFNSTGWYKGTIKPEDFDYTVISDIELANAWFIYDYEHEMYGNITDEKLIAIN